MTEPEFDDVPDPSKLFEDLPFPCDFSAEEEKQRKASLPKHYKKQVINNDQKELY
jgi:hypothetical protein